MANNHVDLYKIQKIMTNKTAASNTIMTTHNYLVRAQMQKRLRAFERNGRKGKQKFRPFTTLNIECFTFFL